MNKATPVLAFIAGAAIGSLASWYFAKQRYEQLAQEDFNSRRFQHVEPIEPIEDDSDEEEIERAVEHINEEKPDLMEYARKISEQRYADREETMTATKERRGIPGERPYVISPDEFGELEDYNKYSLTYYADHVLTDDMDQIIEDVDSLVGFESLTHFGEYEDDSVFVRNDRTKADYEILKDLRTYTEVIARNPYKAEV